MKNAENFSEIDEKNLHSNLIAYAQQYVSLISKKILAHQRNIFHVDDPIRMVSVEFLEPESDIEQVLEFLPGLSISIPCLMNAKNLDRQQNINIKVLRKSNKLFSASSFFVRSLISMVNIVSCQSTMKTSEH